MKSRRAPVRRDKSEQAAYDYHLPVMPGETLENLKIKPQGTYIDGTLGGGGHAARILEQLISGGKLIAFDKDPVAIDHCRRKLQQYFNNAASGLFVTYNKAFSEACSVAPTYGGIDGVLLDLGVSSRQLDSPGHGLSYRTDSKLDMRFGSEGTTAYELLNSRSQPEIEKILKEYGEEPFARLIAKNIMQRSMAGQMESTGDLRAVIEEVIPEKYRVKTLSRVFQGLRIAVNDELGELERTLKCIIPLLNPGGRIVVISYHSLEDRITKNIFKEFSRKSGDNEPILKNLTPKPLEPTQAEIRRNARARSAKMRVGERV